MASPSSPDRGIATRSRFIAASCRRSSSPSLQDSRPSPPLSPKSLLNHLCDAFPARSNEISRLLGLIGEPSSLFPPLLIYGGPSTGKTSIVTEIFRRLGRPFAYTSCRSCHNQRILFESVLNQLVGHDRAASNNYSSARKCDKLVDFIDYLPEACKQALTRCSDKAFLPLAKRAVAAQGFDAVGSTDLCNSNGSADNRMLDQPEDANLQVVCLIFDNLELLLSSSNGFRLISALLRLSEFCRLPNLGLIFISSMGPDAFYSGTGTLEPLKIHFRDYTDEELFRILVKSNPHTHLFSSFLNVVLKPFSRATRRVTELAQLLEPLFEKYVEPIRTGVVTPDEAGRRKLFLLLKPHITQALNQAFSCSNWPQILCSAGDPISNAEQKNPPKKKFQESEDLGFELSLCSKYLLISAFICSRNPPTLDATVFDSGGGAGSKKRRRKVSQVTMEKKELERQEKLLKGPGTFPLERVLAIYSCISDEMGETVVADSSLFMHEGDCDVIADVLMQMSTLVSANLLTKGSSDPLEGGVRYRCNADEELVQKIARSIKFPLSRYLHPA